MSKQKLFQQLPSLLWAAALTSCPSIRERRQQHHPAGKTAHFFVSRTVFRALPRQAKSNRQMRTRKWSDDAFKIKLLPRRTSGCCSHDAVTSAILRNGKRKQLSIFQRLPRSFITTDAPLSDGLAYVLFWKAIDQMTLFCVCVSDRVWLKSWHNEERGWRSGRQKQSRNYRCQTGTELALWRRGVVCAARRVRALELRECGARCRQVASFSAYRATRCFGRYGWVAYTMPTGDPSFIFVPAMHKVAQFSR